MHIGYMADEISKLDEKLVNYDETGKPDNVFYQDVVVYLVEEVKKLKKMVISLNEKISTMSE